MTVTRGICQPPGCSDDAVERAIDRLKSLHTGDAAILEAIACGRAIVPDLQRLLFGREPSGLFQVRVRTVVTLAKLRAYGPLLEFLRTRQPMADPVEQLGDDAVINAAAQALAYCNEAGLVETLIELANRPCLAGVIFALGASRCVEVIPLLVGALSEDTSRLTAERALLSFGEAAQPALIEAVNRTSQNLAISESQLRQKRSAVRLLSQMDVSSTTWRQLRNLMNDSDRRVAILACTMAFQSGSKRDKRQSAQRLLELFEEAEWEDRKDPERCLMKNAASARSIMRQSLQYERGADKDKTTLTLVQRFFRWLGG
jgi:hypothetical protein